jgi:hypothetical protein
MRMRHDKAAGSAESSKRPAEALEDDVPQPPQKKRTTVRKRVLKQSDNLHGVPSKVFA